MAAQERFPDSYGSAARAGEVTERPAAIKRMSWGAVLAGVAVILVIQLLLSLLGLGLGLGTIDPARGGSPQAGTFSIAAGIWWVVSSLGAVFAGGWVAGRLAGMPVRTDGLVHGFVTWSVATLVLFYLLTTTLSSLIGGAFGVVGNALQTAGQGVQAAGGLTEILPDDLRRQVEQLLNRGQQEAQQAAQETTRATGTQDLGGAVQRVVRGLQGDASPADREAAVSAIAQRAGISEQEAETQLRELQQTYRQTTEQARQAAQATADTVSQAGIWSFVALLLGAVVAAVGGLIGTPRDMRAAAYRRY